MPKHFVYGISKHLAAKDWDRIDRVFELVEGVVDGVDNKIALFGQVSNNKELLVKISSLLAMKDITESSRIRIVDLVYKWK